MMLRRLIREVPVIFALLSMLALVGCDSVEERVAKHYERGMAFVEAGEFAKATIEFRNALQLDENHPGARYQIALAYERDGEIRAAFGNFQLAAELDPDNADLQLKLGRYMMMGGQIEQAAIHADRAVEMLPDNADAKALKAAVLLQQEEGSQAVAFAADALAIDPEQVEARLVLASERYADGDVEAALRHVDSALSAAPEDVAANLLKLRILEAEGAMDALVDHLETMVEQFPDEAGYRKALVGIRIQTGDVQGAEAGLREMVRQDPGDIALITDLVRLVGNRGGADAARDELEARLEEAPDAGIRGRLTILLSDLEAALDAVPTAASLLRSVIDGEAPVDVRNEARVKLARIEYSANDDPSAAKSLLNEVLSGDTENAEALMMRASIFLEEDDAEGAVRDLRIAASVEPDNVDLMMLMAQGYIRTGSQDLAAERLAAATRASNYRPAVALRYARFLNGRDQAEAAETVIEETARRHPEQAVVLSALAEQRMRLEDWRGAQQAADALAALQGTDTASRQVEAMQSLAEGDAARSAGILSELAQDPEVPVSVIQQLIVARLRNGEGDQAAAMLDDMIAHDPDSVALRLLRADLHLLANDPEAAEASIRHIVDTQPQAEVGYVALARLQLALDTREAALSTLNDAIETVAQPANAQLLRGQLREMAGDIDGAIADYQALYEMAPDALIVANNLASLIGQYRADDTESVTRAINIAQRLRSSDVPEFQDTYGWLQHLNGDNDAALRSLAPAAAARPNNAWIRFHTGTVLAAMGQREEARAHLEAALAIDPNFPKAAEARATLATLETAP